MQYQFNKNISATGNTSINFPFQPFTRHLQPLPITLIPRFLPIGSTKIESGLPTGNASAFPSAYSFLPNFTCYLGRSQYSNSYGACYSPVKSSATQLHSPALRASVHSKVFSTKVLIQTSKYLPRGQRSEVSTPSTEESSPTVLKFSSQCD
jgi:hypothetical protein